MPDMQAAFGDVLALVRALSLSYQEAHWSVKGRPDFYQDHLLLDRLREAMNGSIDEVAEKGIAVVGDPSFVFLSNQLSKVKSLTDNMPHPATFESLLALETNLSTTLQGLFDSDKMAGTNDFWGTLANEGLQRLYLLRGRLGR